MIGILERLSSRSELTASGVELGSNTHQERKEIEETLEDSS